MLYTLYFVTAIYDVTAVLAAVTVAAVAAVVNAAVVVATVAAVCQCLISLMAFSGFLLPSFLPFLPSKEENENGVSERMGIRGLCLVCQVS